jgi:hypothetical protein
MIFKEIKWEETSGISDGLYEEVPDEDLWEDGELASNEVQFKIIKHVMQIGDWMLVRSIDGED